MTDSIPSKKLVRLYVELGQCRLSNEGMETYHELYDARDAQAEIDRLHQDNARYESGRVVLTGEIDRLRMAERLNVDTVANFQQQLAEAFRLANACTYYVPRDRALHAELLAFMNGVPPEVADTEPPDDAPLLRAVLRERTCGCSNHALDDAEGHAVYCDYQILMRRVEKIKARRPAVTKSEPRVKCNHTLNQGTTMVGVIPHLKCGLCGAGTGAPVDKPDVELAAGYDKKMNRAVDSGWDANGSPVMAMLPNDHHPGPRCSCRACQARYPEENDVAPRPPIKDDPQCPVCRGPDGGHYVGCNAAETDETLPHCWGMPATCVVVECITTGKCIRSQSSEGESR